ncbi:hypothetical protein [Aquisphaera insulae]|uniref:hypothetical protein n=1 Tax=Aquisphaera insulae TaxID=2712864 RepID=UPI0013EA839B|nr:hypothetical protein [Aquisphaera insulae]
MPARLGESAVPIEKIEASAYVVPTDAPESDGTIARESTTLVVEATGGGASGIGYSYSDPNDVTGSSTSRGRGVAIGATSHGRAWPRRGR